jgi:hypothetical protein
LHNWHNELIAAKLEACFRGKVNRLIINVPPRSLKSHAAAIAFPAYVLGHNPSAQIICASYGQDLANKHSMDCRTLMTSAWYRGLFPTRLSPQKQSVQEFVTTHAGSRLCTSVGGVLTGRGADLIIIDDPLKPDEALSETQRNSVNGWYDHTLYSRQNSKQDCVIIIIMQRLHEDDLVGHVLEQEYWDHVRLPAIAEAEETHFIETPLCTRTVRRHIGEPLHPEREPLAVLEHLRRTIGEYNFAGQYQQQPAPLAQQFWSTTRKRVDADSSPTHLTQAHRRKAKGVSSTPIVPVAPRADNLCRGCGKAINLGREHCANCAVSLATERLAIASRLGRAAAQTPETLAKQAASQRRHSRARSSWDESSQPAWLTSELFSQKIQPRLSNIATSVIRSSIGVSRWYASRIRQGYRPHPRHWQALAELVGVLPDAPTGLRASQVG